MPINLKVHLCKVWMFSNPFISDNTAKVLIKNLCITSNVCYLCAFVGLSSWDIQL